MGSQGYLITRDPTQGWQPVFPNTDCGIMRIRSLVPQSEELVFHRLQRPPLPRAGGQGEQAGSVSPLAPMS